ncbi:glycosyltransferase family A protein [Halanaerobium congolense]
MPVYNSERYIKKAILSSLNQTYSKLEVIIINDGLTEGL